MALALGVEGAAAFLSPFFIPLLLQTVVAT